MNPIRREVLNGLFVLVLSTLLSAAVAAFQLKFNLQVWVLVVMAVAIAVGGYVEFKFLLSTEGRETEWLKRVGKPARLELGMAEGGGGIGVQIEAVKAMKPGSDFTAMLYVDLDGGRSDTYTVPDEGRQQFYDSVMEQLRSGVIREYKRLICFDHQVLANSPELRSGILRVGEGPGTIGKKTAEHCRLMLETPRCSVYVAPVVMRNFIALYGTDKASMSVDTVDRVKGARSVLGVMLFHDPPNGEIVEQFRQAERTAERRMVAVQKIVFPEDEASSASPTAPSLAAR